MRKMPVIISLLLFASLFAAAQNQDVSKVQIKTVKVSGDVYLLDGAGGNIAALIGDEGVVLVDDGDGPVGEKVEAAVKSLSSKPIRFIFISHYHGDHNGGNAYLGKQAVIISHDNLRKRMENGGKAGNGGSMHFDAKPQPHEALPILTFDGDATVHMDGEDIRAQYFPGGHTDGDSIVFFSKAHVVHMGDEFVTYGFPFIDIDSGGSVDGMIDAVEKVIAQSPPDEKVIPGHGPICSLDDMRTYVKMLKDTRDIVKGAIAKGQTLDQMRQAKLLDPWKKYSGDFLDENKFLETLYNSLTGQKQAVK